MKSDKETIAITGATGFIGTYVLGHLKRLGHHRIIAVGRNRERLSSLDCEYVRYDLNEQAPDCYERLHRPDRLIHLAWDGLPNYDGLFHMEKNLVLSCTFIKQMVDSGLRRIAVAGTCLEYGIQNGCLTEEHPTAPTTCYGAAKDSLRRYVEALGRHCGIRYHWLRLFYMYGKGQKKNTLMAQLDDAVGSSARSFDMSGGEQLRDYLPVEKATEWMVKVCLQDVCHGVFNISSNDPVSVHRLVRERLATSGQKMRLNLGKIPYAAYEPMAFWGDNHQMLNALECYDKIHAQSQNHELIP